MEPGKTLETANESKSLKRKSSGLGLISFALLVASVALFMIGSGRDEASAFMTVSFGSMILSAVFSIAALINKNSKKALAVISLLLIVLIVGAVVFIGLLFGSSQFTPK